MELIKHTSNENPTRTTTQVSPRLLAFGRRQKCASLTLKYHSLEDQNSLTVWKLLPLQYFIMENCQCAEIKLNFFELNLQKNSQINHFCCNLMFQKYRKKYCVLTPVGADFTKFGNLGERWNVLAIFWGFVLFLAKF